MLARTSEEVETVLEYHARNALARAVAEAVEPLASLPLMSAHEARLRWWGADPGKWEWYSVAGVDSPEGFWYAELGMDHGPDSNASISWHPASAQNPTEDVSAAWSALCIMRDRGLVFTIDTQKGQTRIQVRLENNQRGMAEVCDSNDAIAFCLAVIAGAKLLSTYYPR